MVNFEVYIKGILEQIDDSYTLLQNLRDKPGDLEIIKRETAKITGLLQALANKFVTNKDDLSDYQHLVVPTRTYLNNYDFFREIDTMALLYSDDVLRLKNLRLTILDALSERNLIEHIKATLRENS